PVLSRATQVSYGWTADEMALFNVQALHDSGYTGVGITVCVLDNGFPHYLDHEAIAGQVIPAGYTRDFVWGVPTLVNAINSPNYGWEGHGTDTFACAGANKLGTFVGSGFGATFALGRTEVDSLEAPIEMVYWGMGAE